MKPLYISFLLLGLISCMVINTSKKNSDLSNSNFKKVYPMALRGELTNVFNILDTIDENRLSQQEIRLKDMYYARFIDNSEIYDYNTQDSIIIEIVNRFHLYWKTVMLDSLTVNKADSLFIKSMAQYLLDKNYKSENVSLDSIQQDLYKYFNEFLRAKGYYSNAFGKTGHLYDLFLWKKEKAVNYPIELIDDSIYVTVHLMDDFISIGWSHYTTFGRSYAGGWATREALFCVVSAYDFNSENFKVSYLTHEGQHFSDYKKYPNLGQKDLEYRAKLVELVKSKTTTHDIIGNFINNASNDSNNAHAFANYCIIRDLYNVIFKENYISQKSDWHSVKSKLIKEKSKMLFNYNTKQLDSIGNNIVSEFIN